MQTKTKQQFAKRIAHAKQQRSIQKRKAARKEATRGELALLDSTEDLDLPLHSSVVIEPSAAALETAKDTSADTAPVNLVYFTDASVRSERPEPNEPSSGKSAASITFKPSSEASYWESVSFAVARKGHPSTRQAKMAAIAGAMAIAASKLKGQATGKTHHTATPRVTIFSDSQDALSHIESYSYDAPCRKVLLENEVARRIITSSKVLCDLGAQVELRWVPGDASLKGGFQAHAEAKNMARSHMSQLSGISFIECLLALEDEEELKPLGVCISSKVEAPAPFKIGITKRRALTTSGFGSVGECFILLEEQKEYDC